MECSVLLVNHIKQFVKFLVRVYAHLANKADAHSELHCRRSWTFEDHVLWETVMDTFTSHFSVFKSLMTESFMEE